MSMHRSPRHLSHRSEEAPANLGPGSFAAWQNRISASSDALQALLASLILSRLSLDFIQV